MKHLFQLGCWSLICAAFFAGAASATTITVTNNANSGAGSLRDAIANAGAGDTVVFAPGVTGKIVLTSGSITIGKPLTIAGPGARVLTISGNNASRVFLVTDGNAATDSPVSISNLTLADGYTGSCTGAQVLASGGALNSNESLALTNVIIRDSFASNNGGGLTFAPTQGSATLTIQGAEILNNAAGCVGATSGAHAGGMNLSIDSAADPATTATILVQDTRIEGNVAQRSGGGGRLLTPGVATLRNVRIRGNMAAGGSGGGFFVAYSTGAPIVNSPPALLIDASEISGNAATGNSLAGGGLAVINDYSGAQTAGTGITVTVRNSTISGNHARNAPGGGVSMYGNTALIVQNATIADNSSGQATSGPTVGTGIYRQIGVQTGTATPNTEGTVSITSSIVANNRGTVGAADLGQNASETFANAIALNQSLVGTTPNVTPAPAGAGNIIGQDPLLLPLADYGGPTFTQALTAASPAINAGSNPGSATSDQRGFSRTVGGTTDIGAFESGNAIPLGCLDADGNGTIDVLTDGLLITRATLGFTGTSATNNAIGAGATRGTWAAIRTYLNANCGSSFAP